MFSNTIHIELKRVKGAKVVKKPHTQTLTNLRREIKYNPSKPFQPIEKEIYEVAIDTEIHLV